MMASARITFPLVFLFSLLLFSINAEARTYRVGMIAWIAYSPLNVADTQGIWKKLGVDVEVINFGSNQELNAALENKRIDIALDMIGSWVGLQQGGVPLTILGETDWSYGGDKIISKSGVDMSALKGQSIGVYLDQPSVTYFLSKYLALQKLSLSDVTVVELEPEAMADNFIAGRFNVIVNYDPQALRAIKEGNGVVAATSASWDGVIPEGFVATSENYASMDRKDLANIFRGWVQAVKWSKDPANWTTYAAIINDKTFPVDAPFSDQDIKAMLDSVRIHDGQQALSRNQAGGGLQQYLGDLKTFLQDNKQLKLEYDPAALADTSVYQSVLE